MADVDRFRRDDFDDDERTPPPSNTDNTGTVIATVFGVWAAVIGAFGLVWVIVFLCFVALFLLVFCIIASFIFAIASSASRMQPPQPPPAINQPVNPPFKPPGDQEKPVPLPLDPKWNDAAMMRTYLSDLPEFDAKAGWGKFGKKGMLGYSVNPGELNSPITFQGQRDPQALSTAPSPFQVGTVKYRLNKDYKLFKASVACNDLAKNELGPRQPMTFKVYGDGQLLWVSDPVAKVGVKQEVRLSVEGVKELELRVQCADSWNARAIWLEPQVLR